MFPRAGLLTITPIKIKCKPADIFIDERKGGTDCHIGMLKFETPMTNMLDRLVQPNDITEGYNKRSFYWHE
jgi:hypothetical protein